MDPITSNEDFKTLVAHYAQAKGLKGSTALGQHLGIPRGTASQWLYGGLVSEKGRRRIVQQYPQIFARAEEDEAGATDHGPPSPPRASAVPVSQELALVVKIEEARRETAALAALLTWFLYHASETERNLFRDELGEGWDRFQQLVRAMCGETAFKIARDEGRL